MTMVKHSLVMTTAELARSNRIQGFTLPIETGDRKRALAEQQEEVRERMAKQVALGLAEQVGPSSWRAVYSLIVAVGVLAAAPYAARAEIICTNYGGCWETGKRIFRNGGSIKPGQTIINHRSWEKDSGKPIRIRRVF